MEKVIRFIELSSKYPLSFGIEPKNEKENRLLTSTLEKLFKFTGWAESKDINLPMLVLLFVTMKCSWQ